MPHERLSLQRRYTQTFSKGIKKEILTPRDEPKSTQEATTRAMRILDSKYEKADLRQIAADATSLDEKQKGDLYELLMEFEELFDGTLGDWKTKELVYYRVQGTQLWHVYCNPHLLIRRLPESVSQSFRKPSTLTFIFSNPPT
jgi:hypothetical protein